MGVGVVGGLVAYERRSYSFHLGCLMSRLMACHCKLEKSQDSAEVRLLSLLLQLYHH